MPVGDETATEPWRELLAIGLVAGDMSPETIARCGNVSRRDVLEAFAVARAFGVVDDDDRIHPDEAARLVAELGIDTASRVHAELARHHLSEGREHLDLAVRHAQRVTSAADTEAMIAMCDHSGEVNLSLGDHAAARALISVADTLDLAGDDQRRGRRLLALAAAVDGEGDVAEARRLLERAAVLAERCGDVDLLVDAAVQHTLPTDWYAGDQHSLVLLQRAQAFDLTPDQHVRVLAARSLANARIPVLPHEGQQLAWITRPEVARPLSEQALELSADSGAAARAMALMAWRSTHRSPCYLAQRRAASHELLTIAQDLRDAALQVDAAIFVAVDALESGDRRTYDKALGISRWVADRNGNPRLIWRADTLAAGAAHLAGGERDAATLAQHAQTVGRAIDIPGWFAAMMFFLAQDAISSDDPARMQPLLLDESHVGMNNPLAIAGIAYCFARNGDPTTAIRYAETSLLHLDFESSPLLQLTRLAAVTLAADHQDLAQTLVAIMSPWAQHISVDSNGWWCDGPVALWLGLLHELLGDTATAVDHLRAARAQADVMHDARSHQRVHDALQRLEQTERQAVEEGLSERELEVLKLVCAGASNKAIAEELHFSVSTVRNETSSIYRKLSVTGRAEAVARAFELKLIGTSADGGSGTGDDADQP